MINHKQITSDVTYPTHKGEGLVLVGYFPMPYIHLYFYVMGNSGVKKHLNGKISHGDRHAATGHKAVTAAITHFSVFKG